MQRRDDYAPSDVGALWEHFATGRAGEARERLIVHHLPFARIMAAKLYAARPHRVQIEFDDYLQYARVGLLEAIDRFEPQRGIKFETFAASRVTGAVLNGLTTFTEMQEQVSARKRLIQDRIDSLSVAAPDGADSDGLFRYLAELAIGMAVGFALDDSGMQPDSEPRYPDNAYAGLELRQLRERIRAMIDALPENQRRVIAAHYLQRMPFEEVASMLDLSRGRIAQIHRDALLRLRETLRTRAQDSWDF